MFVKSPKSIASPVVDIVIYSILFVRAEGRNPPIIACRVGDDTPAAYFTACVASPKSAAFPNVAIVT